MQKLNTAKSPSPPKEGRFGPKFPDPAPFLREDSTPLLWGGGLCCTPQKAKSTSLQKNVLKIPFTSTHALSPVCYFATPIFRIYKTRCFFSFFKKKEESLSGSHKRVGFKQNGTATLAIMCFFSEVHKQYNSNFFQNRTNGRCRTKRWTKITR